MKMSNQYPACVEFVKLFLKKLEDGRMEQSEYTEKMNNLKESYGFTDEEFYEIQDVAVSEMGEAEDKKNNMTVKMYEDWKGSLTEYLQIGDYVDEEMVNHFLSVLPPRTNRSRLIQIGEPYSHVNGKATYMTLERDELGWKYAGTCHANENNNVK